MKNKRIFLILIAIFSIMCMMGKLNTMLFAELNEARLIKSGRSVGETVVTTDTQYVHMSTELANQVALYHGFAGAEEFKAAHGWHIIPQRVRS